MLIKNEIVVKCLKKYEEVKEYIDDYDYELIYSEYEELKVKEFYKVNEGYIPVEKVSSLIEEYDYISKLCSNIEEFLEEIDCIIFEEYLLK